MEPSADKEKAMTAPQKLSLIVPVYNEASHLQSFLEQLDALDLGIPKELVFIDDCSSDHSAQILSSFPFRSPHTLFRHAVNQGKGAALRKGIELATGDIIGIQDADFEYSLKDIPKVLAPLLAGDADVVYGSRFKKTGLQVHRTYHYLVNRILTVLSNMLSGLYLSDMETCYKFFRASIIKNIKLESNRFGFEPEVTAKIARLRVRVMEVPIAYFPRNYLEGKKITWKDGVAALRHILVFNLFRRTDEMFSESLPTVYRIKGTQWL